MVTDFALGSAGGGHARAYADGSGGGAGSGRPAARSAPRGGVRRRPGRLRRSGCRGGTGQRTAPAKVCRPKSFVGDYVDAHVPRDQRLVLGHYYRVYDVVEEGARQVDAEVFQAAKVPLEEPAPLVVPLGVPEQAAPPVKHHLVDHRGAGLGGGRNVFVLCLYEHDDLFCAVDGHAVELHLCVIERHAQLRLAGRRADFEPAVAELLAYMLLECACSRLSHSAADRLAGFGLPPGERSVG